MKEAKEGIVVAGSQDKGNCLTQLSNPGRIVVDQLGTTYVADHKNDRIMHWLEGVTQGSIIVGGYGFGADSKRFNGFWNLAFD